MPLNEQHRARILDMVLAGLTRERIAAWVTNPAKNKEGIDLNDLDELIQAAQERITGYSQFKFNEELGKTLARLDELYAQARQIQDFKGAASIERQRAEILAKNRPEPITDTIPAPAAQLLPLSQAANLLGLTPRTLQLWCKGDHAHQPILPHEKKGRRLLVDPGLASTHLQRHARRLPQSFTPFNAIQDENKQTDDGALQEVRSVRELLEQITKNPATLKNTSPNMISSLTRLDTLLLRREIAEEKRAQRVDADDCTKMLRSLVEAFKAEVHDAGAPRTARKLSHWLRTRCRCDLASVSPTALTELENVLREEANTVLARLSQQCEDAAAGVQLLEGVD